MNRRDEERAARAEAKCLQTKVGQQQDVLTPDGNDDPGSGDINQTTIKLK